jgi:hypothetical protein
MYGLHGGGLRCHEVCFGEDFACVVEVGAAFCKMLKTVTSDAGGSNVGQESEGAGSSLGLLMPGCNKESDMTLTGAIWSRSVSLGSCVILLFKRSANMYTGSETVFNLCGNDDEVVVEGDASSGLKEECAFSNRSGRI